VSNPVSGLLSRVLNRGFRRYVRRFVRSNFNAVRVVGHESLQQIGERSLVVYVNHPVWWDPMAAVLLTDMLLSPRQFVAPMDAAALSRYPILERLGFFGVPREPISGAREFLRNARVVLQDSQTALWITPTGHFHDVRQALPFQPGLAHLVDRSFGGVVLPLALEYPFWNERHPEALVAFGPVLRPTDAPGRSADEWTAILARELEAAQDRLAVAARRRDPTAFRTLLAGRVGVGIVYDGARRLRAWFRGERFDAAHGGSDS